MQAYRLNSRITDEQKEFLVQTVNDAEHGIIRTSLFINGEYVDSEILPHREDISEEEILELVKIAHGEKKTELELLLKNYREVLKNGSPELMCQMGKALYFRKMFTEASRLMATAAAARPELHEAFYYISQAQLAAGNIREAIKAGRKCVELKPAFADYRNNLGEIYLTAESCREAVEEFDEAIRRNVYYADAYFNLAIAFVLNAVKNKTPDLAGDYTAKTTDMLNKASLINPFYKTSEFDEALAALQRNDVKRTLELLSRVRQEQKEKQRQEKTLQFQRYMMHADWLTQGNIEERIADLAREIEKNPGYVDLYYETAVCYLHQAKFGWSHALDYFRKALAINPELKKARRAAELAEEQLAQLNDTVHDITDRNM